MTFLVQFIRLGCVDMMLYFGAETEHIITTTLGMPDEFPTKNLTVKKLSVNLAFDSVFCGEDSYNF